MPNPGSTTTRGRQARGDRRVAQILDAAAELFAEVGYQKATTNAVAARAGASPGSLYQFFPNKEALALALADRYLDELRSIFELAAATNRSGETLDTVLDRLIDPLVKFTVANPAFKALFANPEPPENLAASARRLHTAVLQGMNDIVATRAPRLPQAECLRCATVTVQLVKGLLPVIQANRGRERAALIRELKRALMGYLGPLTGGA